MFLPQKGGDLIESHDRLRIKHHQNPQVILVVTRFIGVDQIQKTDLNLGQGTFLEKPTYAFTPNKKQQPASQKKGSEFQNAKKHPTFLTLAIFDNLYSTKGPVQKVALTR